MLNVLQTSATPLFSYYILSFKRAEIVLEALFELMRACPSDKEPGR